MQGLGQSASGFPIDLVLFAMIAGFLVLRLRSILGKKTGFEGAPATSARSSAREAKPVISGQAEAAPAPLARALPEAGSEAGQALQAMRLADKRFDPAQFLTGAEAAFGLIVTAFATGDRVRLRSLLDDPTYSAFETAIAAREEAGHTQRTELRQVLEASITEASLAGKAARIAVHFVSQQINLTSDAKGDPVTGTDAVTEIIDLWTFTRTLDQPDLAWRLAAAHSA